MESQNSAILLRQEAETSLMKIEKVKENVDKVVANLGNYSRDNGKISDSAALMEARRLLEKMRERFFQPYKDKAEAVLDFCTGVLNKTLHINDGYSEVWGMRQELKLLQSKLEELDIHIKKTLDLSEKVSCLSSFFLLFSIYGGFRPSR